MNSGGREGLRMTDVGRLAGVAPSTLYEYFPSKDALILALEEASWADQVTELIGKLEELDPLTFREAVETMVRFSFDAIVARGAVHGITAVNEGMIRSRQIHIERVVRATAESIINNPKKAPFAPADIELALHVVCRVVPAMAWLGSRDFGHRLEAWREEVVRMCVGYLVEPKTLAAAPERTSSPALAAAAASVMNAHRDSQRMPSGS